MAIAASDLLVVNRDGIDYRAPAIELSAIITRYIGNGNLIIKDWEGTTVAKFTANQGTETTVTLPKGFSGSWNDLADKPDVFPPDNDLVDIPLGQLNDVNADGNDGDYFAKLADGTHGFITPPVIGAAVISLTDGSGNAVGQFNVNQVNNQGIQIPTFSGNYLDLINKPTIGDGSIEINAGSGLTASGPNATANQTGDTIRTLSVKTGNGINIDANGNVIIDPSYNLDGNITPPGNGTLTVKNYDGTTATTFTANQETATTVNLPKGFSGSYNDLTDKPAINDGKITINNYDGSEVGTFTVNQSANTTIALPEVKIPESLHPMGFIDVSQPAPANPVHGDIYIQHRNDLTDVVASASFAGLAGRTVKEAQFVMFGVDDLWHAGGDAMPTDVQSDWAQTDTTDAAFILNKPATFPPSSHVHSYNDLTDKPTIGNGALTIKNSNGSVAGTFTANQVGATDITLPAGFSGNYNDLANKPDINNGTLTIKNSNGSVVGTFTANQATNTDISLPNGFSGSYNDLTDKPDIGNGAIQINAGSGLTASGDNATANQAGNTIRILSLNSGDGISINNGDNSVEIDLNYLENNLDLFPEAPADGNIYARNGQTQTWTRALPYDISTLDDLA